MENTKLGQGIVLSGAFDLQAEIPLDSRLIVLNNTGLQELIDGNAVYEGMIVYNQETKKLYQYNKDSNSFASLFKDYYTTEEVYNQDEADEVIDDKILEFYSTLQNSATVHDANNLNGIAAENYALKTDLSSAVQFIDELGDGNIKIIYQEGNV